MIMLLHDMTVRRPEHWVSFMCGIHPKDDDDVLCCTIWMSKSVCQH